MVHDLLIASCFIAMLIAPCLTALGKTGGPPKDPL